MKEKILLGLVPIVLSCNNYCDTADRITIEDVNINIQKIDTTDFEVIIGAPEPVYGMYLITKSSNYEADQVNCKYSPNYTACTWNLKNDSPLGVRIYETCQEPLEILF